MNAKRQKQIVTFITAALALGLVAWAPTALAQITATLTAGVHLRAGPAIVYPSVQIVPAGAVVQVFGCEQGFNWCDVQVGAQRGWMDAAFLQAPSPSGPVLIANSPAVVGVPLVTFSFNNYWDTWYVGRPWYTRRAFYGRYWNRFPHGVPPPIYRPRPPPPVFRPPPRPPPVRPPVSRPPPRPPPGARPPVSRPPPGTRPPPSTTGQ
jgi:uncharacterized protein YraI